MAHGLNKIMIKRDINSSSNNNNYNISNFEQNNNLNKIEQSLNNQNMIKREIIDCNTRTIKSQQTSINNNNNNKSIAGSSTVISPSASGTNTLSCGNTKMGSRRIFTPQFKLQVLESYRNDNDCKGNQRATARKYGIHRRQIQKWLQCESNLRSSVANLNSQNNNNNNNNVIIKHQFHNISHHHNNQQQTILTNLNNSNNNQQYNKISSSTTNATSNLQLSLDSARHTVALNSIQTLTPPLASTVSAISSMAATTTQSSMAGVVITSSSSTSPISIRSPTQINCNTIGKSTSNSGLILHNQQQNTMPYLTHTPAINTSVSVPIPIIPTHSAAAATAAAAAAAAAAYYHQYHLQIQHHNDIVTSQNNQHNQQNQQQIDNCMPSSVSLPIPLNTATAIHQQHHHYHNATTNSTSVPINPTVTTNQTNELRDYQPIYTTTQNPISLSSNYDEFANTSHVHALQEQSKSNYDNLYNDNHDYYQMQPQHQQYEYIDRTLTTSPIDLSLGHKKLINEKYSDGIVVRRQLNYDNKKIIKLEDYTKLVVSKEEIESNNNNNNDADDGENNEDSLIVDLSCRKRKTVNDKYEMPEEKVQKICDNINNDQLDENDQQNDQIQQEQQPKPVKLFKPYLLDDNNDNENQELKKLEQQDPIIWSHHPSSNYEEQCSSRGSNFHGGSPNEYAFPVGSPIYNHSNNQHCNQSHIITSSSAIQSPCSSSADSCCNRSTPISSVPSPRSPGTTQTNSATFWCPKGSPVSGYDTASTYSDSSEHYRTTGKDNGYYQNQQQNRIVQQSSSISPVTYSIDLKMHPVDNYYTSSHSPSTGNLIQSRSRSSETEQFLLSTQNGLHRNHHVQRWLDHDSADVRQGIAVYV